MTFKELLNSVHFEDVAPHIVKMYPEMAHALGWFKIHFDMLRSMQPILHEDANDVVCRISSWEDDSGSHLDACYMEGDLWEHSLTKELIIAPEVEASNEELVACCLWHTSFYGFVEKHLEERSKKFLLGLNKSDKSKSHYKEKAIKNFSVIRRNGGTILTIRQVPPSKKSALIRQTKESIWYGNAPLNKPKRKKMFRREYMENYFKQMASISDFIIQALPTMSNEKNHMSLEQLCGLFNAEIFCQKEIMSYAPDGDSGAKYLFDLISTYDMVQKKDGIIVRLVTGTKHNDLSEDEISLFNLMAEGCRYSDLILDYDPSLGNQVTLCYATYNCDKHYLCKN